MTLNEKATRKQLINRVLVWADCGPIVFFYHMSVLIMRIITQDKIKSVPIALPPVKEQLRIIEKINNSICQTDVIEQASFLAAKRLDELEQATLSKAFRGEV